MDASEKIIVALDTDAVQAYELATALSGTAQWLKVGMTLYYSVGPGIVAKFKDMGYKVFVDLKLHDIPHQVRGGAKAVSQAGADMLTVHASGGLAMMQAACEGAEEGYGIRMSQQGIPMQGSSQRELSQQGRGRPLCLAITVLTSLDNRILESVGVPIDVAEHVQKLASLARAAEMDGVVCSPKETALIRQETGAGFTIVTPGVRPANSDSGDQARVATPAKALEAGADYLVIGRPITEAPDPRAAFEAIVKEMR